MFTSLISLSPIFFTSSLLYCQSIWPSFSSSEDFYWILSFPVIPSSTSLLFPHSTLYGKRSDSICDSKSPRVRGKEKEILQWVKGTREREREREGCHSQTTCFPSQDYASFQIHLEFYISSQQHKLCTSFPFGDWVVCLWLMFAFPVLSVSLVHVVSKPCMTTTAVEKRIPSLSVSLHRPTQSSFLLLFRWHQMKEWEIYCRFSSPTRDSRQRESVSHALRFLLFSLWMLLWSREGNYIEVFRAEDDTKTKQEAGGIITKTIQLTCKNLRRRLWGLSSNSNTQNVILRPLRPSYLHGRNWPRFNKMLAGQSWRKRRYIKCFVKYEQSPFPGERKTNEYNRRKKNSLNGLL